MAQDVDNAQNRLQNIEAVLPILGALRTISLGNWQSALKRRAGLSDYTQGLLSLLPPILRELPQNRKRDLFRRKKKQKDKNGNGIVYALGTERGLCGSYNRVLAEQIQVHCSETQAEQTFELHVVGSRLVRALKATANAPSITRKIPSSLTGMPTYAEAVSLAGTWLRAYEMGSVDYVDMIYNANAGTGRYTPAVVRLIPPDIDTVVRAGTGGVIADEDEWMLVDSEPLALLMRIVEQYTSISLFQIMLEAVATEHAVRYQLMEAADKNALGLIEELTLSIQSLRRQAITREMQELAAGAGLLS